MLCTEITRAQKYYFRARFEDGLEKGISQLETTYLSLEERVVEFVFGMKWVEEVKK